MATATISPDVLVTPEHSRIHNAWLWMRELMRKAGKAFAQGAIKIRVTITQIATSATGLAIAAGTQLGLATRAGWNGAATVVTKGMGLVAKAAVKVAQGVSWVVDKIGKGFSWFVGLFNKKAGDSIAAGNERFTASRTVTLARYYGSVDEKVFVARAAMTYPTVSNVGRTFAGVVGVGAVANVISHGAVAAKVTAVAGPTAALLLGPLGLLATGAIALVGGLFAWLTRRNEVQDRAAVLYYESRVKAEAEVDVEVPPVVKTKGLDVDLTEDDGTTTFKGDQETIDAVMSNVESQADTLAANLAGQLKTAGMVVKPDPKDVTNAVVEESLRQSGAHAPFSKTQMDKRRTALKNGSHDMPEIAEPISA